jgi:seryl-tRNA synthetase
MVTDNSSSADLDALAAAVTATPAPESTPSPEQVVQEPEPTIDQLITQAKAKWDEEHQQEVARFKGQSRKVQELTAQLNYYQEQYNRMQSQLAQIQQSIEKQKLDELPDDVKPLAQDAMEARRRERLAQEQLLQLQRQWEPMAKTLVMQQISQEYGIPVAELNDLNTPQEMVAAGIAHLRAELAKTTKELSEVKSRGGAKAQPFAKGGGAGAPAFDKSKLAGTGKIEEFLQLKREAGEL